MNLIKLSILATFLFAAGVPAALGQIVDSIPCDTDADTDVDLDDVALLHAFLAGPGTIIADADTCQPADQNLDRVADLLDFAAAQNCFSGSGVSATADCAVQPLWREPICTGGDPPAPNLAFGQELHKVTLNRPSEESSTRRSLRSTTN